MFDNVVNDTSARMSAELCAALVSPTTIAGIAIKIREVVETLAMLPIAKNPGFSVSLVRGEVLVGSTSERIERIGSGFEKLSNLHSFRHVHLEWDHLEVESLNKVVGRFEEDPLQPATMVWAVDRLVYAILLKLLGLSEVTLARVYAADMGLDWDVWDPEDLPEHVWFLVDEAKRFFEENFSDRALIARYDPHGTYYA